MPSVGARAARTGLGLDARSVGVVARAIRLPGMEASGDRPSPTPSKSSTSRQALLLGSDTGAYITTPQNF